MFVFKASAFMGMLQQFQPEIAKQVSNMTEESFAETYANFPNLSMDYGLAEKADKVAVVPVDMAWSDLGSWDSIYQRHQKDGDNNVMHGDVFAQDTTNSLLWSQTSLLATAGLDNMVVIQTADATLICDRNRTEEIKTLVARVKAHKPELTEIHRTAHRPWGTYTVLEEGANFKIKRIVVNPGAKLSMQMHKHRSEHWVVVSGEATITNGDMEFTLQANQSTYIPKTHRHRLANNSAEPLAIIEVQCGDYVGEDDIIRFDDTYGRVVINN
jgi:mannose-1-phosphate guanylyltransferase/mannose-6-phosphate isomerase